jgi:hypothetical protein
MTYTDREGKPITAKVCDALMQCQDYVWMRRYNNGTDHCHVKWDGYHTHPFIVIENGKKYGFTTAQAAITWYEDFLCRKCGCQWVPGIDGQPILLEHGNILLTTHTQVNISREQALAQFAQSEVAGTW